MALTDLDEFTLDLHGLMVSQGQYRRGPGVQSSRSDTASSVVRTNEVIEAGRAVPRHRSGMAADRSPSPIGDDEMGWDELADGVIVAGQTNGAPSWFPCNDRPANKASYRIAVTTPSDYHVVANGALVSRHRGASTTTWVYEQHEPMATYLATVQIGRYVSRSVPGSVGPHHRRPAQPDCSTATTWRSADSPR